MHPPAMSASRSDLGVTLIGVGKLLKAAALVAIGLVAWRLREGSDAVRLERWSHRIGLQPGGHWVHLVIASLSGVGSRRFAEISAGAITYATLFAIEGVGLLSRRRWAEYLTVTLTGSFVPFEVYEVVRHLTAGRVVALVLNVAAVAYLLWHLRHTRAPHA